jgi:hypothetical protein
VVRAVEGEVEDRCDRSAEGGPGLGGRGLPRVHPVGASMAEETHDAKIRQDLPRVRLVWLGRRVPDHSPEPLSGVNGPDMLGAVKLYSPVGAHPAGWNAYR